MSSNSVLRAPRTALPILTISSMSLAWWSCSASCSRMEWVEAIPSFTNPFAFNNFSFSWVHQGGFVEDPCHSSLGGSGVGFFGVTAKSVEVVEEDGEVGAQLADLLVTRLKGGRVARQPGALRLQP